MNMISIVVIEFNSLEEINRCISAIKQRCTDVDYEIIVSSNSCYPKIKQDLILQSYPDVLWCFNERNGGFGYGMNQGLKSASGDFLVVMNPDVILKGKISILVDFKYPFAIESSSDVSFINFAPTLYVPSTYCVIAGVFFINSAALTELNVLPNTDIIAKGFSFIALKIIFKVSNSI